MEPIKMLLWCPECGERHIDEGAFAAKVHHTHACQACGMCWRPAVVPTCGVQFLPGFKNEPVDDSDPMCLRCGHVLSEHPQRGRCEPRLGCSCKAFKGFA